MRVIDDQTSANSLPGYPPATGFHVVAKWLKADELQPCVRLNEFTNAQRGVSAG